MNPAEFPIRRPEDLGLLPPDETAEPSRVNQDAAIEYLLQLIYNIEHLRSNGKPCVPLDDTDGVDLDFLRELAATNGWKVQGSWFGPAWLDMSKLPVIREDEPA